MSARCQQSPVLAGSATLTALGALVLYLAKPSGYGKYSENLMPAAVRLPARAAWFLQELPSFAVPAGILAWQPSSLLGPPATVLLGLFCAHYFHRWILNHKTTRTFVYSVLTRGRPFPVVFLFRGFVFCLGNGFLQGYYLAYCAEYPAEWYTDIRFSLGVFLFILGMGINIHSDYILRQLRKPGEIIYRIPQGGLFTYVSGANFLDSTSRCLMTTPSLGEPSFRSSFKETKEQGNKAPMILLKTIKLLNL
ncbi:3-oxo-5-alpha-steroid 4-dehydrogenase 2 isoform X3 [Cervus elaphus]|uniref:3-oxo-5-alpha-steroid 4-dehydrogenase 2 isoform X3 n=1 Tax=Cervus elaphus TaxID=9860 RepID=UPI001CC30921|nr:3-oxo-5-alpha-steroid 4-dehydrogenase 2 isoform X3 [Cervus elaphus]XP_043774250.1 3-oxo-5-alpha-steroid 4-dehydrogenase 2 isoform X3 [Cervus elaphus]XP_043774251.1 3-oxo-5-alpha-steroid 4-dehydrogenase 2 isoform X3 [Cervus elaphus]